MHGLWGCPCTDPYVQIRHLSILESQCLGIVVTIGIGPVSQEWQIDKASGIDVIPLLSYRILSDELEGCNLQRMLHARCCKVETRYFDPKRVVGKRFHPCPHCTEVYKRTATLELVQEIKLEHEVCTLHRTCTVHIHA